MNLNSRNELQELEKDMLDLGRGVALCSLSSLVY